MTDWISRWENNKIGWHADQINRQLIEYLDQLNLSPGDTIFVPLCGKTKDMLFLLENQINVIGVEMSSIAAVQFFSENNLSYSISNLDGFILYEGDGIKIYCGNYFDLEVLIMLVNNFNNSIIFGFIFSNSI